MFHRKKKTDQSEDDHGKEGAGIDGTIFWEAMSLGSYCSFHLSMKGLETDGIWKTLSQLQTSISFTTDLFHVNKLWLVRVLGAGSIYTERKY